MACPKILVTGSCGLIGSDVAVYFGRAGFTVTGIDDNHRAVFFGPEGDTGWALERLRAQIPGYRHEAFDIRDRQRVLDLAAELRPDLIVHAAAQPSHDRAAAIPFLDFEVNALGTLHLLEAARQFCPASPFIHMSTNKVYGDRNSTRGGITPTLPTRTGSPRTSRSTNPNTRFLARRSWPPTSWCRSTAAISECRPVACEAAA
jgi:nucleoside-diphosphate-sugar epimerase